ncbi:MAG: succinate dehydrogenase cytochrome b subunit [Acidobacteriaceae bacterium]|nr:succinate dehydrogenase cytochrome b subunit [Acidobacteriaceae bacterium]
MAATVIGAREIRPVRFWESTNGKKVIMGATGFILFAFIIGHMLGNLQIYAGADKFNGYGHFLHGVPELLWIVRIGLLIAVGLHIWASIGLAARKINARPVGYAKRQNTVSSYASRTMYWSGPILLAFIIYHILHLTAGVVHPGSSFKEGDVYANTVSGFQVPYVSAWYIFSMILLGLHLRHGVWSMFQSLGINHPRHTPILQKAALLFAIIITAGFISIPVSVLLGLVKL